MIYSEGHLLCYKILAYFQVSSGLWRQKPLTDLGKFQLHMLGIRNFSNLVC